MPPLWGEVAKAREAAVNAVPMIRACAAAQWRGLRSSEREALLNDPTLRYIPNEVSASTETWAWRVVIRGQEVTLVSFKG